MGELNACVVCSSPAEQKCSGCQNVHYCSREHQKQDWRQHKYRCTPVKVKEDAKLGRYLEATREIKAGDVILKEAPLITGPAQVTPPVCLGCYNLLEAGKTVSCADCGWPFCSEPCTRNEVHKPECHYTKNRGEKVTISTFGIPHPNYQCITVLRCLYQRDYNKKLWAKLQSLESHCADRKGTDKWNNDKKMIADFIVNFFKLGSTFTEDEIMKCCGIIQINGHEVPLLEPEYVAVFERVSMAEHSCCANCNKSFTSAGDIILCAGVDILTGGHISVCYTDPLWGTEARRHHLAESKFFECTCPRCSDVTEFGTMYSAVKCKKKDCKGYLLPDTFILPILHKTTCPDPATRGLDNKLWKCGNCGDAVSDAIIQQLLQDIGRELSVMPKGDADACERFVNHCASYLHPAHYYMTDVSLALAQLVGQQHALGLAAVTDDRLLLKTQLCRKLADLLETLAPGGLLQAMFVGRYLWLLLCYAQYSRSSLLDEYKDITKNVLSPPEDSTVALPVQLAVDKTSGCICRTNNNLKIIVCFGNYECKRFPKVNIRSDLLRVITTVITEIRVGELDAFQHLVVLQIEANHRLKYLEPGLFRNLTNLKQLSISYNTKLNTLHKGTFEGLKNLRNLTLVNNGFTNILDLTPAFKPTILPALRSLDLSQNSLERIPETAFHIMRGTSLKRLEINLCRLEFIHPNSFEPLLMLKELIIGENDLNSTLIGNFLAKMIEKDINLIHLDLSGMGFRKQPPRALLNIIANTTVERLILAENQFEIITDDTFPAMVNLEVLDLRKVLAISIGPKAFDPLKFPNLRVLLLGGNNLPGIHQKHISNQQLLLLDLSSNKGSSISPMYYEIDRDAFTYCKKLQVLNLAYNRIKSVFDYTFRGLDDLKILSMENGTLYHIGDKTFEPMRHLEMLNLANNPLTANENLTSVQFEGLNELKILILKNCGIKRLYDEDNMFEMMPNLTHLILRNNQLYYITAETLKPLKNLQVLDLSENLLISWWKSLFLAAGVRPINLYLTNNKISHFTISMIQDLNYLLENPRRNRTTEIELMDNVFVCDCSSMYKTYMWLQVNGTALLRAYFASSHFQCSSPDVWEDRRVAEYLSSIKTLRCLMYEKISSVMFLIWTAPSIVTILLFGLLLVGIYKYRIYIRYWMFLAKIAVGRKFIRRSLKAETLPSNGYRFDAFVSYCNDDREFVAEMINQLETTPPYLRLCIYERDFEIGSFISESILNSINQSKYIVLIISNSFAKSQWCRWETQLAEYHRLFLEDGTPYDPLVLIRVGEVDNKYMTTTLKYLLKTKIYHSWDDSQPERFWRKLRDTLSRNI